MKDNKVEGFKGLEKPKMLDELLKGGFKKGEFHNIFSHTGKGTSYIDISHPEPNPEREKLWWEDTLYDADENCEHDIKPVSGGGVKCTKCKGWFCF